MPRSELTFHTRSRRSRAAPGSSSTRPYFASWRRWKLAWFAGTSSSLAMSAARIEPCAVSSEEHTSELQSHVNLVCRLLLEKKNQQHEAELQSYRNNPVRPLFA